MPSDRQVSIYSLAFECALESGGRIYTDTLVLSEFVNRFLRFRYDGLSQPKPRRFQEFSQSPEYSQTAKEVADASARLLADCHAVECALSVADLKTVMRLFGEGAGGYNDLTLAALCRTAGLTMVTDDRGFGMSDLTLLTANDDLLSLSRG